VHRNNEQLNRSIHLHMVYGLHSRNHWVEVRLQKLFTILDLSETDAIPSACLGKKSCQSSLPGTSRVVDHLASRSKMIKEG